MKGRPQLLGIVNITEDSFSDGGLYVTTAAALTLARRLAASGADVVDLGAAASNPSAKAVAPALEIARLAPIVDALQGDGVAVSVDSFSSETQSWALGKGVAFLNDIHGFARPDIYPRLAASDAKLIVMHSLNSEGPARREDDSPEDIFVRILLFFQRRIAELTQAGISSRRLILDPGMGLFLGRSRAASFEVLRRISELKTAFGLPVLVSVSRKSFLRPPGRRPPEAGAATLAAELFAASHGVDYIRTHDTAALCDALGVVKVLAGKNMPKRSENAQEFPAMISARQQEEGQSV
ncbi:MAG TPA: dihydropteroate synthase [Rhizomicrobium sp.]|nr:dihydropteroate synthase [Rhizomicrobium sp.]